MGSERAYKSDFPRNIALFKFQLFSCLASEEKCDVCQGTGFIPDTPIVVEEPISGDTPSDNIEAVALVAELKETQCHREHRPRGPTLEDSFVPWQADLTEPSKVRTRAVTIAATGKEFEAEPEQLIVENLRSKTYMNNLMRLRSKTVPSRPSGLSNIRDSRRYTFVARAHRPPKPPKKQRVRSQSSDNAQRKSD
eukprot:807367_1